MARQKQATPLRREHSSEYMVGTPTKTRRSFLDGEEQDIEEKAPQMSNGHTNGSTIAPVPATRPPVAVRGPAVLQKKQAGLLELVIGVSGIYASLYVSYMAHFSQLTSNVSIV